MRKSIGSIAGAALLSFMVSSAPLFAQGNVPVGIVDQPCPPPLLVPVVLETALNAAFDPQSKPPGAEVSGSPEVIQWRQANAERAKTDWANLCRYRAENNALARQKPPHIIFIGDSITESWIAADPDFFASGMVNRGIRGQTSQQILARFYQDVVALNPRYVHILAGTNDVAGNLGPSRSQDVVNNIAAMIDIAKANRIRVILGAILPAADFGWRPGLQPAAKIAALNVELRKLARQRDVRFVDYYKAMAALDGGMLPGVSSDGVHPNRRGYEIMESSLRPAIR